MYPKNFKRPIPLKDWMTSKGLSNQKAAKFFGDGENVFTPNAIQKMIANPNRDVGVWNDDTLVETVEQEVVGVFVDGQHIQTDKIIYIKKIKPRKNLGPNPNANNAAKGRRVNVES